MCFGQSTGSSKAFSLRHIAAMLVCVVLVATGCNATRHVSRQGSDSQEWRVVHAQNQFTTVLNIDDAARMRSTTRFGAVDEGAELWQKIANDSSKSDFERRCAVYQLIVRHYKPGMLFSKFCSMLGNPSWFDLSDVRIHRQIPFPLDVHPTNSLFSISVLSHDTKCKLVIFFEVTGRMGVDDMFRCIRQQDPSGAMSCTVKYTTFFYVAEQGPAWTMEYGVAFDASVVRSHFSNPPIVYPNGLSIEEYERMVVRRERCASWDARRRRWSGPAYQAVQ